MTEVACVGGVGRSDLPDSYEESRGQVNNRPPRVVVVDDDTSMQHMLANYLEPQSFYWTHPGVDFVHGDFLQLQLQDDSFDLIINCSSIEHVGVAGRYGITESDADDDGDLEVIEKIVRVLKPGGKFLMTGPCGKDAVLNPWCRVYGERRLPRLLQGLKVEREFFWRKNEANQWTECDRENALSFAPTNHPTDPHSCAYNLGCFALRK
jgi:SAM-dependent methyltransferase